MKNQKLYTVFIFPLISLVAACSSTTVPISKQSLTITKNLQCSPGNICDVELSQSESVNSIALSNPATWDATLFYAGQTPHVLVKNKSSGSNAEMFVYSNLGSYKFLLTSTSGKNENIMLNKNYSLSGDTSATFAPIQVYDDGARVYIKLPNISSQNLPAFYLVNNAGKLQLVNFRLKDDTYIVDDLFSYGVLILNKQNEQKVLINKN